ncbi:hypothetical protein M422DRAFT_189175 [Sphaerobolus stellatus SS14]|uniref:Rab-GAP TBC domain-containing protein n=1 Tax=Sphaerobolus stellatus (strain SS14) TaxID=990650 RepID=A0A0C9THB9_SPHS4|nr:hypothetical protein M422DRAFT_189175 [Sphaerobolus stellatus SS14]
MSIRDYRSEISIGESRTPGPNGSFPEPLRKGKGVESLSVRAHRERELRWVSTINSTDSAQAKRNKKIRKLLTEGVPSSVRYMVWAHVSNSGSRKLPGVYAQLSKRRPAVAEDIERDVEILFPDAPQLQDKNGPLVSVLFAFITMVPDIRYSRGLAIIAGHLLLQSPEEDAFWIFLGMMDSYLRPYFSLTSSQLKVDTSLFMRSVETLDMQLATRVFAELKVRPNEICTVWFSSAFAGVLPLEHLHRVWDLFFYEGIPLLFRTGLAIFSYARPYLLNGPMDPSVTPKDYLLHPPAEIFPTNPEEFINQVLNVRLKDDDIRKARVKMEAAAKQQQQGIRKAGSIQVQPGTQVHLGGGRQRVAS